jgi:hypothetical protein
MTEPEVAPAGTGTTMLVSLQLVGAPLTPLNVIVLAPCDPPKLVPEIVIAVPVMPDDGDRPPIEGDVTVNEQLPAMHRGPWPFTAK